MTIRRSEGWLGCDAECDPYTTTGEVSNIMRALEREVVDAVYAAIEPLLPEHPAASEVRGTTLVAAT